MRDILEDLFGNEPLDPIESARRNMRPNLRKRFYQNAAVGEGAPYPILLDGRAVKTPAGSALAVPARALGASDRRRVGTRKASASIPPPCRSRGSPTRSSTASRRTPSRSRRRSRNISAPICSAIAPMRPRGWCRCRRSIGIPILAWARETLGARFVLSEGVMFVAQPESAVAAARAAIPSDPWRLGAVNVITTLTGSALIALAVAHGQLGVDDAWTAAHVDEDWNMKFWGRDELALQRRATRFADMQAAGTVSGAGLIHGFRSVNERFTLRPIPGGTVHREGIAPWTPFICPMPSRSRPRSERRARRCRPGQVVQALVLELIESDVFRLQLPQAVVDVRSDVPLTPGSTITLARQGHGRRTRGSRSIPTSVRRSAAPAPRSEHAAPSLAGKQPIGEAVIIGRTPAAPQCGRAEDRRRSPAVARCAIDRVPRASRRRRRSRSCAAHHHAAAGARRSGPRRGAAAERPRAAARRCRAGRAGAAPGAVPAPVRAAAEQVLALRVPLDANLTGADLKQAFVRSGVLFEPRLAAERRALPASTAPTVCTADVDAPRPRRPQGRADRLPPGAEGLGERDRAGSPAIAPPASPAPASAPAQAEPARPRACRNASTIRHLASALAGAADELLPPRRRSRPSRRPVSPRASRPR